MIIRSIRVQQHSMLFSKMLIEGLQKKKKEGSITYAHFTILKMISFHEMSVNVFIDMLFFCGTKYVRATADFT